MAMRTDSCARASRSLLKEVSLRTKVTIHPSRSGDISLGVKEQLCSLLLRYDNEKGGVVLTFSDVVVHGTKAKLLDGINPYLRVDISAKLLLFSPSVGAVIHGRVNNVGSDFVGLLVLGAFNASVCDQSMQSFHHEQGDAGDVAWVNNADSRNRIEIGTEVRAVVESVQDDGEFIDLHLSLDHPNMGSTVFFRLTQGAAAKRSEHVEKSPHSKATQGSASKKKKSKCKAGDMEK